ncbi:unnamed protein product [marine sediment metagenome]|uniref:DUF4326 domain-containing protein n=1 Tax=marine sediment metagenome TaxID=412755 RepID=X1CJ57_9ZZZZ
MTKVVHCKKEPYDIYIGRPSKWKNPFIIGEDGTREEVIEKYRKWIVNQPFLMNSLHELKGKTLGCWCKPTEGFRGRLLCHGQILVSLIENVEACEVE